MSKENDQNRVQAQNRTSEVYIRGMNVDKGKEIVNTKEKVLGMTPSQALVFALEDKLLDPNSGERFSKKLNQWIDWNEDKEIETRENIVAIKPWLQTVVEKALMDVDQKKYRAGEESIIDWGVKRNMDNYYAMTANMEAKWKVASLFELRNVDVNTENISSSEVVDGELLQGFKDTFGVIGEDLHDIYGAVESVLGKRTTEVALPLVGVALLLASCARNPEAVTKTPTVASTPVFEASPSAGPVEFSRLFTPETVFDLPTDSADVKEGKDLIRTNLEIVAENCRQSFPDAVEGSQQYSYTMTMSGEASVWSFCRIKEGDKEIPMVVSNYLINKVGQMGTEINKAFILLDDGSFGYVDQYGNQHSIYNVDKSGIIKVYNIDGKVISSHQGSPVEVGFFDGVVKAYGQAELTPTPDTTATAETLKLMDQLKFEKEIPQLSQKEMSDIVAGAYRFKDEFGNIYALGYIPQTEGYFSVEGIVIDMEKSTTTIDGDEFWRLLMITEDKKAGGFETAGEKKFMIVPMYIDKDKENKYKINYVATPGGAPSIEGGSLVNIDTAISALMEQKEKHGNFQINAVSCYSISESDFEATKLMNDWKDRENRVMRIYNNSEESKTFVGYMLNNDYDSAVNYLNSEKPYLAAIDIAISSD